MTEDEIKLVDECIEAHRNMIAQHRRQIIELSRKTIKETEICMQCFDIGVNKK